MSLGPFFEHADSCAICQCHPRTCAVGARLLKEGTERLTKKMIGDPERAKA